MHVHMYVGRIVHNHTSVFPRSCCCVSVGARFCVTATAFFTTILIISPELLTGAISQIKMEDPIAIIGFDARLPGDGDTPEKFYEFLLAGRSARTTVPTSRYNAEAFWHPDSQRDGSITATHAHFLKGSVAAFDAPFFSITPAEAANMDPQQRGILQCVYRALENSGITLEAASGSNTGVYVGCFSSDYRDVNVVKDVDAPLRYAGTGTIVSMLSNRVSWFYDFQGPSLTIDTACSSSLVAAHQACVALRAGDVSMAVVGGTNLILSPELSLELDALGVLSPDGISYSFDKRANGYSRGEGFGAIVLKRLSDAVRDGDTIRAVIRNTCSNHDGHSPGLTQPTKDAQVQLMRQTYAGLDPSLTRYVEAHGTGTPVGDPIEASAISEIFTKHRSDDEPLYVGAMKSNVGHLEGAAGIAAIIKAVMTLEHGVIPANAWFENPNTKIDASWRLSFPTKALPWPKTDTGLRRMSINSFGVGGTNAHMVLDDAFHFLQERSLDGNHQTTLIPKLSSLAIVNQDDSSLRLEDALDLVATKDQEPAPSTSDEHETSSTNSTESSNERSNDSESQNSVTSPITPKQDSVDGDHGPSTAMTQLFVLSAHDQEGVSRVCQSYEEYVASKLTEPFTMAREKALRDLCFTLGEKRTRFTWRTAIIADSLTSLAEGLREKAKSTPIRTGAERRLALVFTGQGAQWATMGMKLMALPTFRQSIEAADSYLESLGCQWSLIAEMSKVALESQVDRPEFSQPLCTALQVALVDLLRHWGISYSAVAGHSSGEIGAAYAIGAFSAQTAWKLSYYRGKLSAKLASSPDQPRTTMAAVGLTYEETLAAIQRVPIPNSDETRSLGVACRNSLTSHTVSGDAEQVGALVDMLNNEKTFARKLKVDMGYHSHYMQAISDEYIAAIGEILPPSSSAPAVKEPLFFSSTFGERITPEKLREPSYWTKNLVSPVLFHQSISEMLKATLESPSNESQSSLITDILEVGPHRGLEGPLRNITEELGKKGIIQYHGLLRRGHSDLQSALEAAGSLFCRGISIDLSTVNQYKEHSPSMLTDLPGYPFNLSKEYWSESQANKSFRNRKHGRHELLGAPILGWNKTDNAVWRNWIRLSENPWIEDHQVSGDILYPAAGMLVMAIEACRQTVDADAAKPVKGFKFREVSFHSALQMPDDKGVESRFYLRPVREAALEKRTSSWREFQLFTSQDDDDWREHCRGQVQIEYEDKISPVDGGLEKQEHQQFCQQRISDAQARCAQAILSRRMYGAFRDAGLEFGPSFQTLTDLRIDPTTPGIALARVNNTLSVVKSSMAHAYVQEHLIHPTTLDGIFQTCLVPLLAPVAGASKRASVPIYLDELWISSATSPGEGYVTSARTYRHGRQESKASFEALEPSTNAPAVSGTGLIFKTVNGDAGSSQSESNSLHKAWNIEWKPSPVLIDSDQAQKIFGVEDEVPREVYDAMDDGHALCALYTRREIEKFAVDPTTTAELPSHLASYVSLLKNQADHYYSSHERVDLDRIGELEAQLEKRNTPEGGLTLAVGRALPGILSGAINPLSVIFSGSLADDFYLHGFGANRCYAQLRRYLDSLAHVNPGMKILEVGAGTGGTTRGTFDVLGDRYQSYDFTDISPFFFEQARKRFPNERMNFRVLDIERSPADQGFDAAAYDVVVATNVLHATKNLDTTLTNVKSLLKPGGRLLLSESTDPGWLFLNFIFGLLPGWWLSQDADRLNGALTTVEDWNKHLTGCGFTGLDAVFPDHPNPEYQFTSVIVSGTPNVDTTSPPAGPAQTYSIIADPSSALQNQVADTLSTLFKGEAEVQDQTVLNVTRTSLEDVPDSQDTSNSTYIILTELESPTLLNMTEEAMKSLKRLMSCKTLIWLTQDGTPEAQLVTGFASTIRLEYPAVNFVTVMVDTIQDGNQIATLLPRILESAAAGAETSFRIAGGVINIPRLVEAEYMTSHIDEQTQPIEVIEEEFGKDPARSLRLQVETIGLLDTIRFEDNPVHEAPLGELEVEFETKASGVNFHDLAVMLGQVEETALGLEGAGVVSRVGAGVTRFQVGDRVFGFTFDGSFQTHVRSSEGLLAKIPDALSFAEAAAIPIVYTTAYACLYDVGNLQRDEDGDKTTVLIHAAAGGVGQAAIQLAQRDGAEVFATVGSLEKRDFIESTYGIPRDHIFSSRDLSFKSGIMRMTKGRGVDIILNSLAGDALRATWDCVAPLGRFAEIGRTDIDSKARISMGIFSRSARFEAVELCYMQENDPKRMSRLFQRTIKSVFREDDVLKRSTPITASPFSKIQDIMRLMQTGKHLGKLVMEPHVDDVVHMLAPRTKGAANFQSDATYVVAGGLGGLGQVIVRWMVDQGAKHLVLLSRNGPQNDATRNFIAEIESNCDRVVTPKCDITDSDALSRVMADALSSMPPVRGCIQASMVLHDTEFENMTLEQWQNPVRVKVDGTRNLWDVLGNRGLDAKLDFFIMLSSTTSVIGNPSQSSYSAGNAYQDALARQLASQGHRAISLNVPMLTDAGFVFDKPELMEQLRSIGWTHITCEELLAVLDYHCRPSGEEETISAARAQVVPRLWLPQYTAAPGLSVPQWQEENRFSHLTLRDGSQGSHGNASQSNAKAAATADLLSAAKSPEEAQGIVVEALLAKLSRVLSIDTAELDAAKPLNAYGIDSLVAVELRSWTNKEIGADLSVFEMTGKGSISQLAATAVKRSRFTASGETAKDS
ncbi:beta-ketoacyl synthase domain-containing protein [Xylariomycetidae sp. FL2044]|nr:beta-ketoacyl synthase domain-containing protein [Xylariomycetidae sp. FL2044]